MNEKLAVHGETVLWKPGPDAAAGPMGRFLASASARHVPDEIVAVPGVPVAHAGKNSSAATNRMPDAPAIAIVAPTATSTGGR